MNSGSKIRILIFIGSLRAGGKERRLIELLTYLKSRNEFEILVVLTRNEIHYTDFYKLDIPVHIIKKTWTKNDLTVFYKLFNICKFFKPHLIHSWGRIQSFYTLPAVIGLGIPLVNSQITEAPPKSAKKLIHNLIDKVNFRFSKAILSNSKAGILSYNPPIRKRKVIYNGINMNRFTNLPDSDQVKSKYGITTPYSVIMVASFTTHKDYNLFFRIASHVTKLRNDVSFIGVGGYDKDDTVYKKMLELSTQNPRIIFPGRINDVEALVNACTIGVLFSNKSLHGEGISNSIMEYMCLSKPVIANDAGGTKELIRHRENGYLITNESEEEIVNLIIALINDQAKAKSFGTTSKKIIEESFSLDKMGQAFVQTYKEAIA